MCPVWLQRCCNLWLCSVIGFITSSGPQTCMVLFLLFNYKGLSSSISSHSSLLTLPLSPIDQLSDEGVVARGRSSRRDPDAFLSVPDGDCTRAPTETQSLHASPQKQGKTCACVTMKAISKCYYIYCNRLFFLHKIQYSAV